VTFEETPLVSHVGCGCRTIAEVLRKHRTGGLAEPTLVGRHAHYRAKKMANIDRDRW
jgi:hypothetical protein